MKRKKDTSTTDHQRSTRRCTSSTSYSSGQPEDQSRSNSRDRTNYEDSSASLPQSSQATSSVPLNTSPGLTLTNKTDNMAEMADVAEQSDDDDFGITRPPLIKQLQSILDQYPDDGQILKELIQNAEDAKATKVCFLYDETQYGTDPEKLAHPELAVHQGPALYAFNDAVFDANDWKGIGMLQDSIKTKDPMKVGRFGLGFKSVFHLTDMPSVLSDKRLGFIDPLEKYFRDGKTGMKYRLSDNHSSLTHQFEPFQNVFGCDQETFKKGCYNGTIFRFPLRQKESALSDTLYTRKKMDDLFASFERDAHLILLFLKHIESVELRVRREGSPVQIVFKVQVQDDCRHEVQATRKDFLSKLSATSLLQEPAEMIFPIHVETLKYKHCEIIQKEVFSWLISEYFAGGDSITKTLQDLCCDQKCRNIPLVGVAYLLKVKKYVADNAGETGSPHKMVTVYTADHNQCGKDTTYLVPGGHAFCSLPLPVEQKSSTGLPVHVNGFFSINQDRRHLKWPSQGQDIHSDKEILWNQCLLRELLPRAYLNLILRTVQLCKEDRLGVTPQHVLQALPDKIEVEVRERWQVVLEPLYTELLKHMVFYSQADGGEWTQISECVVDCLEESAEICFAVRKVLSSVAVKVVELPKHVMLALTTYSTQQLKTISPQLTREYLTAFISEYGSKLCEEIKTDFTAEEKRALCQFLGMTDHILQPQQIKMLSSLPLFETIPYGENRVTDFVAVNAVPHAAPLSLPIEAGNTPLLDLRRECYKNLAKKLGVKVLSHAEFITDVMFAELRECPEPEKLGNIVDYIINNFQQLQQEKVDFVTHVQKFPFLLTKGRNYVSVLELFDPQDEFLRSFFYAEDKFPRGCFAHGRHLSFLREIGLKQNSDIQAEDFVSSAFKVQNLRECEQLPNLTKKSNTLVEHLSKNVDVLRASVEGKLVKDWLTDIHWMACRKEQPDVFPKGLEMYDGQAFLDPGRVLPCETVHLAGLVSPICESPHGQPVLKALGISGIPNVTQVLQQMKIITEAYHPRDKAKFLYLVRPIYAHLAHLDKEGVLEVQKVLADLNLSKLVWNGDGFSAIDKVISCQTPMDFRPYLFPLPEEFKMFETMFHKLGMHDNCCVKTLMAVLQDIKEVHSSSKESVAVKARDLQVSINILNLLKDQVDSEDENVRQQIVIPVRTEDEKALRLLPIEDCTCSDLEWLQQGIHSFAFQDTEDIIFIHPNVPLITAKALNVPTLMNRMLQADELDITGFGQCETLTNRIRSLLEDYTDGYSIVKELVQNADDAGATIVKFMYDERSNVGFDTSLLNKEMKECQGAALWAYNNAMFSEKDFENITKLGGATKENETDKIGKFGLGFNAVYNVTDVPSFVSGRHLVIFDPQTKYLGETIRDRSKPGIRIDLKKNRNLVRKLPDQFHPYKNIFDCNIDPDDPKEYSGTLFRLPLRTARQASCSEISKLSYDRHEMMRLLTLFMKGSDSLLLFTQHVRRIELHHMPSTDCKPVMLFGVEKEKKKTLTPLVIDPGVGFDVLTKCNNHSRSLKQESGVNDVMKTSMVVEMKSTVTGDGCSFFTDAAKSSIKTWLISFVFNITRNSQAQRVFNSGYCPYGSVAIPLKRCDDDFIPDPLNTQCNKGALYCHLPLPIDTNLPVHINGSFAIHTNRRQLHELTADDKNSWKAEWNHFLLQNAICPAYILLLHDLLHVNKATRVEYVNLWPILHSAHTKLDPLVESFYGNELRTLVMLHDGQKHVTLSQAAIFEKSLSANLKHNELALEVFKQSGYQLSVINVVEEILETLHQLNHSAVDSQMYDDSRFLVEVFFPHVSEIESDLRDEVLLWALELEDDKIIATIQQTDCIPASPNGNTLKKPSELLHPASEARKLYSSSEGKFVHLKDSAKVIRFCRQLGMKTDFLAWKDLIERGHSIEQLSKESQNTAHDRAIVLLTYLDKKLENQKYAKVSNAAEVDNDLQHAARSLSPMKILPLAVPPEDSILKWANGDLPEKSLVSADEAFISSDASLLSSCCTLVCETLIQRNVQGFLQLQGKDITVDQVLRQFESVLDLNPFDLRKTRPLIYRKLQKHIERIYTFLNNECAKDIEGEQRDRICSKFGQQECILFDGRFVRPCCLAFNDENGAVAPFLYSLPDDFQQWRKLLEVLGVKEHFEPTNYIIQLEELKTHKADHPVSDQEHFICLQLLHRLCHCVSRTAVEVSLQDVENVSQIYAPNVTRIMMPASELCYNNCPWIDAPPDIYLAHPDITYRMAITLGLKTQRMEKVKDHVTGIPFGQTANITTSLRRIIDYYPLDQEILKEFIQNADDATATKIHFVLDHRMHGQEKLFDDSWKPLQGPALCVYNNRPFTSQDLEGIQDLGEGSKRKDPCKTGKYGIGFSAVYHLTDVPSIMTNSADTGDVLCVFDPHCCYVPGATEKAPGQKYENLESLRCDFPDVFTGYMEADFNLKNSTMFRFPLRTSEMAENSKISKRHITAKQVEEMLDKVQKEALQMLLFLNYLEDIEVSFVDEFSGKLFPNYAAHAHMTNDDKRNRQIFHEQCLKIGDQLKLQEIALEDVKQEKVEYTVHLSDNKGKKEIWRVNQIIGFSNPKCVSDEIREAYQEGKLALLPRGGVASLIGKRAHRPCEHAHGKAYCSLPMPIETKLPVHINGHFAMSFENRQHVWLHSGADTEVRLEWNHLLCKDIIAMAYVDMLKGVRDDVLGLSELHKNLRSKESIEKAMNCYENFFPEYNEKSEDWSSLVSAVYSLIASLKAQLFPCISEYENQKQMEVPSRSIKWLSLCEDGSHKALFCLRGVPLDKDSKTQDSLTSGFGLSYSLTKKGKEVCLKEILQRCQFNIIEIKTSLMETIKKAGFDVELASSENVLAFFKSYSTSEPLCDLGKPLPSPIEQTYIRDFESLSKILKYCKLFADSIETFEGTPLLLTNDGNLRVFDSNTPVYLPNHYPFFAKSCGDLFVYGCVSLIFHNLDKKELLLKTFTMQDLLKCLPRILSDEYHVSEELPLKISSNCVMEVWDLVSRQAKHDCPRNEKESDDDAYQKKLTGVVKRLIEPLKRWCLLPIKKSGTIFLYRVSRAKEIVDTEGSCSWSQQLSFAVSQLDVPKLENDILGVRADVARMLIARFDQPVSILSVVSKLYDESTKVPFLTPTEKKSFLKYFGENLSILRDGHTDAVGQLRSLPFYETICNELISLTKCTVNILPSDMHTEEMDAWQNKTGIVFLRSQEELNSLFSFIGCVHISVVDVYCLFILKQFDCNFLTRKAQVSHLKHLFDTYLTHGKNILPQREKDKLLRYLTNHSVITDEGGQSYPASYFYDPDVSLFNMMEKDRLAPGVPLGVHLAQYEWLSMLRKIGLIQHATCEMCVQFARHIAQESQSIGEAVLKKSTQTAKMSKELAKYLLAPECENQDEILREVNSIPFIANECVPRKLAKLYQQYGDRSDANYELPYISFKGSYSRTHLEIIWTCASVLPPWADPFSKPDGKRLAKLLEVDQIPPTYLVAHNFKNICSSCIGIQTLNRSALKPLCKKSYEFMQDHGLEDGKLKYDLQDLMDIACISVGGKENFAKPWQTTFDMLDEDEIQPYFFKISYDYGDYKPLLMALGASESPRFDQYAQVLDKLHRKTANKKLMPDELLLVYKALKGLFSSLDKESVRYVRPAIGSLSLLGKNGRLYKSTQLIFNDAPWLYDRIKSKKLKFLVDLKECVKTDNPEQLLARLPPQHRPKMLSTCVKEELVIGSETCLGSTELTNKLQERLHEDAFRSGVIRLAHHQAHKTGQKLSKETLDSALDHLSTMKIYGANDICTRLLYENEEIDEESRMQKKCCVEKIINPLGAAIHQVYLKNDADMGKDILIPFVEALNLVLNGILKDSAIFLPPILGCNAAADINAYLDRLDVLPHSPLIQNPTLPNAGTFVPTKLHCHLADAEQSQLKIGNYVAVKVEGNQYIYGIVCNILENGKCSLNTGEVNEREIIIQSLKTFAGELNC